MALLKDIKTFILVSITVISIIQIEVFGTLGLIIYGLLIAYGIVFILLNLRKLNTLHKPISIIAFAYYFYFILADCINGNFVLTGPSLIQYLILLIIAFSIRPTQQLNSTILSIAKIMTIMGIVVSISSVFIALLTYYFPDLINKLPQYFANICIKSTGAFPGRASGVLGNANITGGYSFVCAIFSMYLMFIDQTKKWKSISCVNYILSAYMIFIFCNSRSFILALLSSSIIFIFLYFLHVYKEDKQKIKAFKIILICAVILFIILGLSILYISQFRTFIFDRILRVTSLSDGSGRLEIYKTALELGKGNRVFGYSFRDLEAITGNSHAHNIFIELLSFGGIPSLLLFCIFFFYTGLVAIKNVFAKNTSKECCILSIFLLAYGVGYFICGLTGSDINRMRMTTVCLQIAMGFIHVIAYNIKNVHSLEHQ